MSDLLFFPMSMPDEILHSRITRYHFLSGNRTATETFQDLFGSAPFSMGILPKQIEELASRLPGDPARNLDELICANTIFPAYRPFLGVGHDADSAYAGSRLSGVARIPRREAAVHGKAKLCLTCVQQDLLETGSAYWHRSHHLPGVSVCWRHGESLMHACPKCSHPFFRKLRLLPNPTEPCVCGWSALDPSTVKQGTAQERNFAQFAYEVLQRSFPLVSCEALGEAMCGNAGRAVLYTENLQVLRNYLTVSAQCMEMKLCREWIKLMKQVSTTNGYGLDLAMAKWICQLRGI